jgi:hypothetical protein
MLDFAPATEKMHRVAAASLLALMVIAGRYARAAETVGAGYGAALGNSSAAGAALGF